MKDSSCRQRINVDDLPVNEDPARYGCKSLILGCGIRNCGFAGRRVLQCFVNEGIAPRKVGQYVRIVNIVKRNV